MARKPKRGRPVAALDARHYQAIALLVSGSLGYDDVARACGVDRRTLYRWRQRKDFNRALNKAFDKKSSEWLREMRNRRSPRTVNDIAWFFGKIGYAEP